MADEKSYGWAGKILRVNLTTGSITTESTAPYKEYIGGMGLANKIMYDEVPAGTDPLSEESKIVYAVGPLTASGVPLAGRTTISFLSTFSKDHLVVDAHCGGMIGARIRVMVVGIPNVGKSTFINSFAGAARAKAANKPGVTRGKQWITVDDYDLMDMPGVLWKKFDSLETATNLAFIGSIKDDILDIEELACGLLSGVRVIYPQRLMERYKLDEQALALPPYDLLQAIGAKRGMLISGGEVDTERAAKMLVGEFRASKWGRISLERPPQRAEVTDWEGDDADEDEQ